MSFANSALAKDPSIGVVGLVPCALGGSNISSWGQGSFLYDRLVTKTRAAMQGGGKIQAMLWYQGESDMELQDDAELYMGQLVKFFQDLRCDLESP
ncbi:hypothetical protein RHMOL_Rhmol07G0288100 [Rhododendron molle]|uniref:Uncharacterized protein n=1 Tax=Rhododendron molle TaxID=49168 RepID=A0ACC0N6L0_RHOML|nr:hypothetical protein RHMOL_Rhmol07G0288100 [Rhododendron molle]